MQVFPVGLDVSWQTAEQHTHLHPTLKDWLVDTRSLTERIESLCSQFKVMVLGQGDAPLYAHEIQQLPLSAEHYHVREVILLADSVPWVFARSIIPISLLHGEWQALGSSPLGKQLFNDKRFVRSAFELATLPSNQLHAICKHGDVELTLYARRSAFHFAAQDILVAEVFLPDSPVYRT